MEALEALRGVAFAVAGPGSDPRVHRLFQNRGRLVSLSYVARIAVRRWPVPVGSAAAALAYCWFAAALRPFTAPMDAAIALPTALMAVPAALDRSGPGRRRLTPLRQAWPWVVLTVGLVAVELMAYLSSPRDRHPTLSSMADALMATHAGRAAAMAAWLALGFGLFASRTIGIRHGR